MRRAVESALKQTYLNTEVIIVDNNSTDSTWEIASALVDSLPQKILLAKCAKQGCSAARNAGTEIATGEWLQFLDADDVLESDKISAQLAIVEPETRWVIGGYRIKYGQGKDDLIILPHVDPWRGWAYDYRAGHTCANLFHRKTLIKIGGWNELYPDYTDPELHFRLLKANIPFAISHRVEMTYIQHGLPRISNTGDGYKQARKAKLLAEAVRFLSAEKPVYFAAHAGFFRASLLSSLRVLATTDIRLADSIYKQFFSGKLEPLDFSIVSKLTNVYRLFGFKTSELARVFLSKYISIGMKEYVKKSTRDKSIDFT